MTNEAPFWQPEPTVAGGLTLHWTDPWGNGDLYETATGDWFVWKGSLGDYPKLGEPRATAVSETEARIWLRRARQRQRDRERNSWDDTPPERFKKGDGSR